MRDLEDDIRARNTLAGELDAASGPKKHTRPWRIHYTIRVNGRTLDKSTMDVTQTSRPGKTEARKTVARDYNRGMFGHQVYPEDVKVTKVEYMGPG